MNVPPRGLTADAKLVRVVLENCGPLAPPELAAEAYLPVDRTRDAVAELADCGLAEPVCGMCDEREEVFALTAAGTAGPAGGGSAAR